MEGVVVEKEWRQEEEEEEEVQWEKRGVELQR